MQNVLAYVKYGAKAIVAGVVAFAGTTAAALFAVGDEAGFADLSTATWLTILVTTVVAVGGVFGISNAAAPKP